MLPFHLKEVRIGKRKRDAKGQRHADDIFTDEFGGPIQKSITEDLVNHRMKFTAQLLEYKKENEDLLSHWKLGTAFSIFKDAFGSSKIAMLHLIPPARVDREAYSQLIYAACLALFKKSFSAAWEHFDKNSTTNCDTIDTDYNDACFAIFSLFALYETNPLPRQFNLDNPLELLPVSLRSSEESETSYRRCFSKHIRIDRCHFSLLLRLKELSLVKRCECERALYQRRRLHLQEGNFETNKSSVNGCNYGMCVDMLEILERIFPRLQLSEYTGPLGAEAFAGHPEYPHNKPTVPIKNFLGGPTIRSQERTNTYELNAVELSTMIGKYKSVVEAIQIPSCESYAVKRMQEALNPLLSSTLMDTPSDLVVNVRIGMERNEDKGKRKSGAIEIMQKYKIALGSDVTPSLRKQLNSSIAALLNREKPIPLPSDFKKPLAQKSWERDDLSSIGCGGVSIATGQGREALKNLLAAVRTRSDITKRQDHRRRKGSDNQIVASAFLTSRTPHDKADTSDESSLNSDISIESFDDHDGMIEDEVSVATSAFGKRALNSLLETVMIGETKEEGNNIAGKKKKRKELISQRRNDGRKRIITSLSRSVRTKRDMDEDELSEATSAFGRKALDDLLYIATEEDSRKAILKGKAKKKASSNRKNRTEENDGAGLSAPPFGIAQSSEVNDDVSVATSTLGRKALDNLLQSAEEAGSRTTKKKRRNESKRKDVVERKIVQDSSVLPRLHASENKDHERDDDVISVATSTYGKRALEELLDHATVEPRSSKHTVGHSGKRKKRTKHSSTRAILSQKQTSKKEAKTPHDEEDKDDNASTATSTFGRRALEDLLDLATKDDGR